MRKTFDGGEKYQRYILRIKEYEFPQKWGPLSAKYNE